MLETAYSSAAPWFMQLNPARGRKHSSKPCDSLAVLSRFMQLNPARGRKLRLVVSLSQHISIMVYAAQPREGTETRTRPQSATKLDR